VQYKADWRRNSRKEKKEFAVSFSPAEVKALSEAARRHRRSRTRYIHDACIAYSDKRYLVPDILAVSQIRELLALNYTAIQNLFDENLLPYQTGIALLQRMEELERIVLASLQQPPEKENAISSSQTKEA
jgi:hypothetical protein